MKLLPFHRVSVPVTMPVAGLRGRLADRIGSVSGDFEYEGRVDEGGFVIRRIRRFRSTMLPAVHGRFVDAPGGARLRVLFLPSREVIVFLVLWLSFLGLAVLLLGVAGEVGGVPGPFLALLPLLLMAVSWLLSGAVFEAETRWAEESLRETLAEIGATAEGRSP